MCKVAKEIISRMCVLFGDSVDGNEVEMFYNDNTKVLFQTTRKLLNKLTEVEDEIVQFWQTRNDTVVHRNKFVYYHDYLLSGDCDDAIKKIVAEFVDILSILQESLPHDFTK